MSDELDVADSATRHAAEGLPLSDLKYFEDSFWRNEESGERRVQFFVALVAAVVAGLVALVTEGKTPESGLLTRDPGLWGVTAFALAGLLGIGGVTLLRIVRRNRVSEEYKAGADYVRAYLKKQHLPGYQPFVEVKRDEDEATASCKLAGGLADFVAVINGIILFALVFILLVLFLASGSPAARAIAAAIGLAAAVGAGWWQIRYAHTQRLKAKKSIRDRYGWQETRRS